jgi:hypothetical protein
LINPPARPRNIAMDELIAIFAGRGDLAHLALLLWASSASALCALALRELGAASRRFDEFVRELARFNDTFNAPRVGKRKTPRRRAQHAETTDG